MEEPTEIEDWELLNSSDTGLCLTPKSADDPRPFEVIEAESDDNGGIKSDYFALDPGKRYAKRTPSKGDAEGGLGFAGIEPLLEDPDCFRSDKSPDGRSSPPGSEGEVFREENRKLEVGLEGIDAGHQQIEGSAMGKEKHDALESAEFVRTEDGVEDSKKEVGFEGIDAGHRNSDKDAALKEAASRETEEAVGSESGYENPDELGSGETVRMEGRTEDSKTEVGLEGMDVGHQNSDKEAASGEIEGSETGNEFPNELGSGEPARMEVSTDSRSGVSEGNATLENLLPREGEKRGSVWLKLPLDLLKFCIVRVRPVWYISIAAGIIGILMLGRRLYKMKRKSRSLPPKVSIDDKKTSQLMVHAARLNEAFSVVRRVSIIRSPPPAGGVTLWPVVGLL